MQKWQYYVPSILSNDQKIGEVWTLVITKVNGKELEKPLSLEQYLNILGEKGWELVTTKQETLTARNYIFKRPKPN
ncbi:MAG: hypothetical protein WA996_18840 [Candidatus Promineifilaceae bacterium]